MTTNGPQKPACARSAAPACETAAGPEGSPTGLPGLPRIIADIGSREGWDGLLAAFRARVAELGTTYESVDHVAGLPTRYVGKLLAPVPIKGLGPKSFGPLLGALALRALIVVDEEAMARIASRLLPAKMVRKRTRLRALESPKLHGLPMATQGRIMHSRWMLLTTPQQRRKWARNAIRARWRKRRKPSMLGGP